MSVPPHFFQMAYHRKKKIKHTKVPPRAKENLFFSYLKMRQAHKHMQINAVLKKAQYSYKTIKIFYINLLEIFKACYNISAYNGRKLWTEPTTDCTTASSDWRGEQKFSIV